MTEQGSNSNLKTAIGGGALLALLASNIYLFVQLHDMKAASVKQQDAFCRPDPGSEGQHDEHRRHHPQALPGLEPGPGSDQPRSHARGEQREDRNLRQSRADPQAARRGADPDRPRSLIPISPPSKTTRTPRSRKSALTSGTSKTQVVSTQDELHKTVSQLAKVQGDLGVHQRLTSPITARILRPLKRLGERNYFEFNISKTKEPQKIGDIQVLLRKTDPKKSKFTLTVMADDKSIEKKDRTANEPVQFYVNKARQPYEIVVNTVRKDQISGYLATPKDTIPR